MSAQYVRTYPEMIAALAQRRRAAGYCQLAFDDFLGVPDGYTGKIEAFNRTLGPLSFGLYLQALGLSVVLTDSHVPLLRPQRLDQSAQLRLPLDTPPFRTAPAKRRAP